MLRCEQVPGSKKLCGFGLVEVLVAMLLLSSTLLGFLALQLNAQAAMTDSQQRYRASLLAADMAGNLQLDPLDLDIPSWQEMVAELLPGAEAGVTGEGSLKQIQIDWQNPQPQRYRLYVYSPGA